MSEQLKAWLKPAQQSLKRAVNNASNPLIRKIYEDELAELEKFLANIKK